MDWDMLRETAKTNAKRMADKSVDFINEANDTSKKSNQETKLKLMNKSWGQTKVTFIRKDVEGLYYISNLYNEELPRFTFENLEFEGSTIIQETKGNIKKKSRTGSALAGGLILGPIGAVAGASRKRKNKVNTKTTSKETEGKGVLHLRNMETKEISSLKFTATGTELSNIERFFN